MYQHLMNYWTETMQDDIYMIVTEGWQANPDLIPPALLIARYFKTEQGAIESRQAEQEALSAQVEELNEEHSGEDGLLEDARNDKGKITKASIMRQQKELTVDDKDEADLLDLYLQLLDQAAEAGKNMKDAQQMLDAKVVEKYNTLTQPEIINLVVDDKWLAALAASVQSELDRISQTLTARIKELAERYEKPLPQQTQTVEELTGKVDIHLKMMGFLWK